MACEAECNLCMESMRDRGRVALKCAHEMCPECFAKHARVNHTCPFCRDEFSTKPKKQVKMPSYQLDYIADNWADAIEQPPPNLDSNES